MNRREFLAAGLAAAPFMSCGRLPVVAAREPVALVTADLEAHVAVVSLGGHRVVRRVQTIEGPRSIQSGAGAVAIVGHSAAGAVSLLEGRPPRVRRVLRGFSQPRYSVFHPDGRHAYVTDSGTGELAVIDLERGRVIGRVEVGALARHVTIDPAGRRLWISLGSSASAISVVGIGDPRRPRLLRHVRPPFLVHDVGFAPGGRPRVGHRRPRPDARRLRRRRPRPAPPARRRRARRSTSRSGRRAPTSPAARAARCTSTR